MTSDARQHHQHKRFGQPSAEASNVILKAKGKGADSPVVNDCITGRFKTQLPDGQVLSKNPVTLASNAIRCTVGLANAVWNDKTPALIFPEPEAKRETSRNAAPVHGEGDAGTLP